MVTGTVFKNQFKMKIKSLFILSLLAICSVVANAASHHKDKGIWYALGANGTATVAGISDGMAAANVPTITIPASFVDGDGNPRTVTGFEIGWANKTNDIAGSGENTQDVRDKVTTLNVDVTNFAGELTADAFSDLTALVTLKLSGEYAKNPVYTVNRPGAPKVKTLDLSTLTTKGDKGKVVIAADAFSGNTTLQTISMPAQDTEIGGSAFQDATALQGIDLTNVTNIGLSAFKGCNNAKFTSLTIPAKIGKNGIGTSAFENMASLTTVTITNDNLEAIDAWFAGDVAIKTVTITANNLTTIKNNAFGESPIETLTITAPKLTTIGSASFAAYKATKIDLTALTNLTTVYGLTFPKNAYTSVKLAGTKLDNTSFANALQWLTASKGSLKTFTLPGLITAIPDNALKDFTKLEEIALTKNIETIGKHAFDGCIALATITIPAKVTTIDEYAFQNCNALATIDLSGATELTTIGNGAFKNCAPGAAEGDPALTTIAFPAKLQTIGQGAFTGCGKLATADFSKAAELTGIGAYAFNGTALTKIDLSGCAKLATGGVTDNSFPKNFYTSIKLAGTQLEDTDLGAVKNWMSAPEVDGVSTATTLKEFTFPAAVTAVPDFFFQ